MASRWPRMRLLCQQTGALLKKSWLTRGRAWQFNLLQVLQSVLVVFLIWLVNMAVTYSSNQFTGAQAVTAPPAVAVTSIPDCRTSRFLKRGQPCLSLIYTPHGNPMIDQLMAGVMAHNDPPLPADLVQGMANQREVDTYLAQHPQTVLAAIHFRQINQQKWSYVLQTNESAAFFKGKFQDPNTYVALPVQVAVEREFARMMLQAPELQWRVALLDFPHPSLLAANPTGRIAPVFLLASLMVNTVLMLQTLVGERESGLRGVMTSMGLMDSAYWGSLLLVEVVQSLVHTGLLTLLMMAFGFDMATRNSPVLLFLLLFTSSLALTALALVLSTIIRRSSLVVPAALVEFILAWIFMLVLAFGLPYNGSSSMGLVVLFSLFPWSILGKGMFDLADAVTGTKPGISWEQRSSYCWASSPPPSVQAELDYFKADCAMPLAEGYLVLLAQAGGYLLLALYLDAVVPREPGGAARHWAFLLQPSTWRPLLSRKPQAETTSHAQAALLASETKHIASTASLTRSTSLPEAAHSAASHTAHVSHPPAPQQQLLEEDVEAEQQLVKQACLAWLTETAAGEGSPAQAPLPMSSDHHTPGTAGSSSRGSSSTITGASGISEPHAALKSGAPAAGWAGGGSMPGVYLFGMAKRYWKGQRASRKPAMQASHTSGSPADHPDSSRGAETRVGSTSGRLEWLRRLKAWWAARQAACWLDALHPLWLHLPPGECFCLLGPNGAGKTTTAKCLLGAATASAGEALVWGHSVRSTAGLQAARHITGVCPQFDVLWPQLTALEHLVLFHHIKGVSLAAGTTPHEEALRLLDKVGLAKVAGTQAATFSGGMRRRLSLAIALLGDPRLLVLDEPTTGLDPVSRRHVWSLLSEVKPGRSVLLTTHSMEEADVVGDRVGVCVAGRLRCLGSPLHLKSKYGTGLRVAVGLVPGTQGGRSLADRCAAVRRLVKAQLLQAEDTGSAPAGTARNNNNNVQPPSTHGLLEHSGSGTSTATATGNGSASAEGVMHDASVTTANGSTTKHEAGSAASLSDKSEEVEVVNGDEGNAKGGQ